MKNDLTTTPASTRHLPTDGSEKADSGAFFSQENLISYFKRIGYSGASTPTLATLKAIHLLHPQAIAFENLNPFFRIPVKLDLTSIQDKLVNSQRGGYCFEHNLLLGAVLKSVGFEVRGLAARVQWNRPENIDTPRGHMLLLVGTEGKSYIADVGFGGNTLTAPLLLEADKVQETPHGLFRLVMAGEEYQLQANVKNQWRALYKFSLQEHLLSDYEVSSWYLSNHPESHFVTGLVAARVAEDKRFSLRNSELAIHFNNAETEKQRLSTPGEIKAVLREFFKIDVPEFAEIDKALAKIVALPDA